ncbi:protelomerase family protein [Xanthobacter sp. DSM 14520]|uniref:protelomerase family protein n=1 Tax=Xanthobacter autotrophicus (strain ATCC BAA-1158 / Py2) TaxID=78245 RepID=UPI00372AA9C2
MIRLPRTSEASTAAPVVTAADRVARASLNQAGRPPKLQAQMAAFVDQLRAGPSLEEAEQLWKLALEGLADKAVSTRVNYVSRYRTEIKAALGEDSIYLPIAVAPEDWVREVQGAHVARVATLAELMPVPHWREIVERARDLLASPDPLDVGIGLIVLTGRRPVEVFSLGDFERVQLNQGPGRVFSRWAVMFSGQTKTRGAEGSRAGQAYMIPTLAPAGEIVEAFARLRQAETASSELTVAAGDVRRIRWADMAPEDFKRAFSDRGLLRQRMPTQFADLMPEGAGTTAHTFRALYAELSFEHFAKGRFTKNSFFAAILGHTAKDLETSFAYMKFAVPEDPDGGAVAVDAATSRRDVLRKRIFDRLEEIGLLEIGDVHGEGGGPATSSAWSTELLAVTEAPALEPEAPSTMSVSFGGPGLG